MNAPIALKRVAMGGAIGLLMFGPLFVGGEFKGTDDQASSLIEQMRPGFAPWMTPVWEPPGKEIESLLFSLQAALGAGVLGYVIGRQQAKKKSSS